MRTSVVIVERKLGEKSRSVVCGTCKLEMMIESRRKKRMELDEKVDVLVAELEREENVREKAEVEARNLREEAVKGKSRSKKVS